MSWLGALIIVAAVYLTANIVLRRFGLFTSALSSESLGELISRGDDRPLLLDVRSAAEYRQGHIPTAVNIAHDSIARRPPTVSKDAIIVLYCQTGSRSVVAKGSLRRLGFTNVVNFGPIRRWKGELIVGTEPGPPQDSSPVRPENHAESEDERR